VQGAPGHLLNAGRGGPVEARNLTALTHAANGKHRGIEDWVKNVINACFSFHDKDTGRQAEPSQYWYGMRYRVFVSDEKWAGPEEVQGVAVLSPRTRSPDQASQE
jgi:hypothetical protein